MTKYLNNPWKRLICFLLGDFTLRPLLRKAILKKLATGRRETYDGLQICLTPEMLALILNEKFLKVSKEIKLMTCGGLIYQPFPYDQRFFRVTIKGQKGQPVKFAA